MLGGVWSGGGCCGAGDCGAGDVGPLVVVAVVVVALVVWWWGCGVYASVAADGRRGVGLGGRRLM